MPGDRATPFTGALHAEQFLKLWCRAQKPFAGIGVRCFAYWLSVLNLIVTFGAVYFTTTRIVKSKITISISLLLKAAIC